MTTRRLAWIVSLTCFVPHLLKWVYYASYPGFDDAFIHLRVADNVASGRGWGINAFEPINVSSSPLFTMLLAAGVKLGLPDLGFGMGLSLHAGMVVVADGTPEAAKRLERVLTNDPATGVLRHVDAGYESAIDHAEATGLTVPMASK